MTACRFLLALGCLLFALPAAAKVDLVVLPTRDTVQLTIYNSADLTLVRERRELTLRQDVNRLQFSWENTLIDPTSLDMIPLADAIRIDVFGLLYPPRTRNLGVWEIRSGVSGKVPVEISYFTSGLAWRAFYMGTLSTDEKTMRLQGYVRVQNNSGEDYENAETRLIVGKVHLLDRIAALAQRQYPYGRPAVEPKSAPGAFPGGGPQLMAEEGAEVRAAKVAFARDVGAPKEIVKEGLSEYFLYTIAGTETIPNGWAKRLPSFTADTVPVLNLYKFEEKRWGPRVVRFLSFRNDEEHDLGDTPIPGGVIHVSRILDPNVHLSYQGRSAFQYIPVGEDVELDLGAVANVTVEPKLMNFRTDRYLFDNDGNVAGWDEIREYRVEIKNTRELPVKVEITRNIDTSHWEVELRGDAGEYEKIDLDTVRFTLTLEPQTRHEFSYLLSIRQGSRRD